MSDLYVLENSEEKEPLFTNSSVMNEQGVKDAMRGFMGTPSWILVRGLFLAMAATGIVIAIRGLALGMDIQSLGMGAIVAALSLSLYVHRFLLFPSSNAKKVMKQKREKYKKEEITLKYSFYDNIITSDILDGEDSSDIEYDNVNRVFRTKSRIVISTYRRQMLLINPDGFDKRSEDEFLDFMKGKCPNAFPKKQRK